MTLKTTPIFTVIIFFISFLSATAQTNADLRNFVDQIVKAREASWQEKATVHDIDRLLDLYSDSVELVHTLNPQKSFKIAGKSTIKRGLSSHLGETKNVKIIIVSFISIQNIAIVELQMDRTIVATNRKESNRTVHLYEFDATGKVKRIVEYI